MLKYYLKKGKLLPFGPTVQFKQGRGRSWNLKTTHNSFRNCRVHFLLLFPTRLPRPKKLYTISICVVYDCMQWCIFGSNFSDLNLFQVSLFTILILRRYKSLAVILSRATWMAGPSQNQATCLQTVYFLLRGSLNIIEFVHENKNTTLGIRLQRYNFWKHRTIIWSICHGHINWQRQLGEIQNKNTYPHTSYISTPRKFLG